MLRDYFFMAPPFKDVLSRYEDVPAGEDDSLTIVMSRILSPDSFIWKLDINNDRYYLYAEDFIDNLQHVIDEIESIAGKGAGSLVKVKRPTEFNELEPVQAAEMYTKPEDYDTAIKQYASDSGYDLLFLYKVSREAVTKVKGSVSG
jgi:hypothetical protein